jgi:hypothetical protein
MNKEDFIDFLLKNNFIKQNSNMIFLGHIGEYLISADFYVYVKNTVNIRTKIFNFKTNTIDIVDINNKSYDFAKNYINKLSRKTKISKIFK